MTPPSESGREPFCLGSNKHRSQGKELPENLKSRLRAFYRPFLKDLSVKFTGENYSHWNW